MKSGEAGGARSAQQNLELGAFFASTPEANVRRSLVNKKFDSYVTKIIQDPNFFVGQKDELAHETIQQLSSTSPFVLSFPTRLLFFKLSSFAACSDLNRTIYFLV